jgi:DNA-binding response OmpR family regulator
VTQARTGPEALDLAAAERFDTILLDVMLPGLDGREVCQRLRLRRDHTPILMLTALDAVEDRVEGLRLGADDYLAKPFAFDELLARIEALIRRSHRFAEAAPRQLVAGDLVFDRESLTVTRAGQRVELTSKELALLELLMSAPGRVFSRERILNNVWGLSEDPLTNVVDVYIRRLRRKLDGDGPLSVIATVRGAGYRLDPAGAAEREGGVAEAK